MDADLNNVLLSVLLVLHTGELAVGDSNDVYPAGTFCRLKIKSWTSRYLNWSHNY
jgi:hypothetical protein